MCSVIRGEDRRASFTKSTSKMWPNAQGDVKKVIFLIFFSASSDWRYLTGVVPQRVGIIRDHQSGVTGSRTAQALPVWRICVLIDVDCRFSGFVFPV